MGHPLLWVPFAANSGGCPIWQRGWVSHLAAISRLAAPSGSGDGFKCVRERRDPGGLPDR